MHKLFGCGTDIEDLARFDRYIINNDFSLMEDICTHRELEQLSRDTRLRFALSFSCKEAFFKALGVSWTNSNIFWKDIELLFDGPELDNYSIRLTKCAKDILLRNNAKIQEASFEYNDEFVMFQVLLLTDSVNER